VGMFGKDGVLQFSRLIPQPCHCRDQKDTPDGDPDPTPRDAEGLLRGDSTWALGPANSFADFRRQIGRWIRRRRDLAEQSFVDLPECAQVRFHRSLVGRLGQGGWVAGVKVPSARDLIELPPAFHGFGSGLAGVAPAVCAVVETGHALSVAVHGSSRL
jgi:hypothetical protein